VPFEAAALVLRFRNNGPMASCCMIDFVAPGVDDWLAVDVVDEGQQAFLEFVFGSLCENNSLFAVLFSFSQ